MQKGETRYSALRRIFRQRVVDFFKNHPEVWLSFIFELCSCATVQVCCQIETD
jgi:hypothetical protein